MQLSGKAQGCLVVDTAKSVAVIEATLVVLTLDIWALSADAAVGASITVRIRVWAAVEAADTLAALVAPDMLRTHGTDRAITIGGGNALGPLFVAPYIRCGAIGHTSRLAVAETALIVFANWTINVGIARLPKLAAGSVVLLSGSPNCGTTGALMRIWDANTFPTRVLVGQALVVVDAAPRVALPHAIKLPAILIALISWASRICGVVILVVDTSLTLGVSVGL
jgi:hypothetical protein